MYCNFKFESQIPQNGRLFHLQLFSSVKLIVLSSFSAGNSCIRGQTTTVTASASTYQIQSGEKQFKKVLISRLLFGVCPTLHTSN